MHNCLLLAVPVHYMNSSSASHIYINKPSLSSTTDALCVALYNPLFAIPTYAVVCALEEVVDVQQEGPAVGGAALLGEEGHAAGQLRLGVVTQQGHEGNAESDNEGQGYCQPDVSVHSTNIPVNDRGMSQKYKIVEENVRSICMCLKYPG